MKTRFSKFLKSFGITSLGILSMTGIIYWMAPKPPRPPRAITSRNELESYIKKVIASSTPPGLSLAVVKGDRIIYQQGFGVADGPKGISASADTVYHWWSMTKVVTAIAILQLQEKKLLSIDDPVTQHLPFFQVQDRQGNTPIITIRQLLNHSAGLRNNVPEIIGWVHWEGDPPRNQTELLREKFPKYTRLAGTPGERGQYSNVGYMVLGAVIEAVTGQRYEEYVVENILRPLKMDHTDFIYTKEMAAYEASGSQHIINFFTPLMIPMMDLHALVRERDGMRLWFNRIYNDQTPPTGLIGPVSDLACLIQAYLNEGTLGDERILSPESTALMSTQFRMPTGQVGYQQGIAWHVYQSKDGRTYLSHAGGGPGFATEMRIYPEDRLGMVIMGNDTTFPASAILDAAAGIGW